MFYFTDLTMYTHLAPAFINDDTTDMTDQELIDFNSLQEDLLTYLQCSEFRIVDVSEESYFTRPEIGGSLLGDCSTYNVAYKPL